MEREEIITQTAKFWLGEDGIIRGIILPTAEHTLTDAKENTEASEKLSKGEKHPVFIDLRKCKSITSEARAHYARKEAAEEANAIALFIGSPVSKVIGNFFLGLNKPLCPTRLFTSEAEALGWLKGFIK